MARIPKKRKAVLAKLDQNASYDLAKAAALVKEITTTKFDASVDVAVRLGVDPRKANQMVRGIVTLPHGTGKTVRVLVLCTPDKEAEAKAAGADHVGLDDYLEKIKGGWTDFSAIIATPDMMREVGKLGKVLGPRGLMPTPKAGTVTYDVAKAVQEVKAGKIEYKTDKTGAINSLVGKLSFESDKLLQNIETLLGAIVKSKPSTAKGQYLKSLYLSSTMGPGLKVELSTIAAVQGG